jgi:hypothetical protein
MPLQTAQPPRASQERMLVFQAEPPCATSTFAHTMVFGIKMFALMAVSVCCLNLAETAVVPKHVSFTVQMTSFPISRHPWAKWTGRRGGPEIHGTCGTVP